MATDHGSALQLVDCPCQLHMLPIACRGEALKVVMDFTANAGLLQVAQLLYQLEVMLLQSSLSNTKVSHTYSLADRSVAQITVRVGHTYPHNGQLHTQSVTTQSPTTWLVTDSTT